MIMTMMAHEDGWDYQPTTSPAAASPPLCPSHLPSLKALAESFSSCCCSYYHHPTTSTTTTPTTTTPTTTTPPAAPPAPPIPCARLTYPR